MMANATTDRDARRSEGLLKRVPVGAARLFKDTLVCYDANGFAVPAADAENHRFAGVAYEGVDNSGGAAGDRSARVRKTGEYEFEVTGTFTQASVGAECFVADDQTVSVAATTHEVACGTIAEYISATRARVRIDRHAR